MTEPRYTCRSNNKYGVKHALAAQAFRTHAAHPAHRCGNDFPWPPGKALIAFRQPAKRIFIEDCAPHRVAPGWNGLCGRAPFFHIISAFVSSFHLRELGPGHLG
jgi:hypothetical protein